MISSRRSRAGAHAKMAIRTPQIAITISENEWTIAGLGWFFQLPTGADRQWRDDARACGWARSPSVTPPTVPVSKAPATFRCDTALSTEPT